MLYKIFSVIVPTQSRSSRFRFASSLQTIRQVKTRRTSTSAYRIPNYRLSAADFIQIPLVLTLMSSCWVCKFSSHWRDSYLAANETELMKNEGQNQHTNCKYHARFSKKPILRLPGTINCTLNMANPLHLQKKNIGKTSQFINHKKMNVT